MSLKYMKVLLFEISYKKKITFSPYSIYKLFFLDAPEKNAMTPKSFQAPPAGRFHKSTCHFSGG